MGSVRLPNHAFFFKTYVLWWERWSLLGPGASWSILPLIQTIHSFCLSKDHLRINTFFLLFYSDKVSHGDSWDSRKPISFLVDQTSIYIKTIHLFLMVWIRGLLVSCLRVACLVLRDSQCNYWYITVSEWRHHLASLSGLIFRPCLICKYNNLFSLFHHMWTSTLFDI